MEDKKLRISFDMQVIDHKRLKMFCVEKGISIKDFIANAALEKLEMMKGKRS